MYSSVAIRDCRLAASPSPESVTRLLLPRGAAGRQSVAASDFFEALSLFLLGTSILAVLRSGVRSPHAPPPRSDTSGEDGDLPIAPRFWPRVPQPSDGCWIWPGSRDKNGYGLFWINRDKYDRAHRVAYRLTFGSIPAGFYVLHSCDNPPCVRPDHLRAGTQRENIRQAIAAGRHKHPAGTYGPMVQTVLRHA